MEDAPRTAQRSRTHIALMFTPDLVEACVRAGFEEQAGVAFTSFESFAKTGAPDLGACSRSALQGASVRRCRRHRARVHRGAPTSRAEQPALRPRTNRASLWRASAPTTKRLESREHLRAAFAGFEALGTEPWAERAAAELRASGQTARKRDPSTIDELTPQELQIVRCLLYTSPSPRD